MVIIFGIGIIWAAVYLHLLDAAFVVTEETQKAFPFHGSRAQGQMCWKLCEFIGCIWVKPNIKLSSTSSSFSCHPIPWWWQWGAYMSSIVSWSKKQTNCILHFLCWVEPIWCLIASSRCVFEGVYIAYMWPVLTSRVLTCSRLTGKSSQWGSIWVFSDFCKIKVYKH